MVAVDLLVAFALDFVLGDPDWFPHPVRAIGYLVSRIESFLRGKLSRTCRSNGVNVSNGRARCPHRAENVAD